MIALYRFRLPSRLRPDALAERLRHRAPQRGLALELRRDEQAERDHFRLTEVRQGPFGLAASATVRADSGGSTVEVVLRPSAWLVAAAVFPLVVMLYGAWRIPFWDLVTDVSPVLLISWLASGLACWTQARRIVRTTRDLVLLRQEEA